MLHHPYEISRRLQIASARASNPKDVILSGAKNPGRGWPHHSRFFVAESILSGAEGLLSMT
jgi:hypothetical protein